jgi:hypothetical protein
MPMAAGRAGNFMIKTPNGECMISKGETTNGLAARLSNGVDSPVIDQTGLKGKYDLRLRYDPSSMPGGRGGPKDPLDPAPAGGGPAIVPSSVILSSCRGVFQKGSFEPHPGLAAVFWYRSSCLLREAGRTSA